MSFLQDVKHTIEHVTGLWRPSAPELPSLVRKRKPQLYFFKDDGETPNNPRLPLVHYRSPVKLPVGRDPASVFEELFASNLWRDNWRDGVYPFNHFHTHKHECLGVARGMVRVKFGGARGRTLELKPGDVIVTPAGTGHRRIHCSRDLLVVGAYPSAGKYDEPKPREVDHDKAVAAIADVPLPHADPVYGKDGPLLQHWR